MPPQSQDRVNDAIRASQVRLIGESGQQLGIKPTREALEYAYSKNLDLVEVAATADPPVAKVMDWGKYRYEQEQKAKLARKHQTQINVKEIKLRPKIGIHDYNTKKGQSCASSTSARRSRSRSCSAGGSRRIRNADEIS